MKNKSLITVAVACVALIVVAIGYKGQISRLEMLNYEDQKSYNIFRKSKKHNDETVDKEPVKPVEKVEDTKPTKATLVDGAYRPTISYDELLVKSDKYSNTGSYAESHANITKPGGNIVPATTPKPTIKVEEIEIDGEKFVVEEIISPGYDKDGNIKGNETPQIENNPEQDKNWAEGLTRDEIIDIMIQLGKTEEEKQQILEEYDKLQGTQTPNQQTNNELQSVPTQPEDLEYWGDTKNEVDNSADAKAEVENITQNFEGSNAGVGRH